jgi:FKBP-type peptidyl-prolyl cis-trans isomerase
MEETGSGLWVGIYQKGSGPRVEFGKLVTIEYSIMLLNGELIYSSATEGKKVFVVGRGGVEAGLEEGILLLREGDKARLIMPPHLAHGFHGDGERIPRRATIVYELELIGID